MVRASWEGHGGAAGQAERARAVGFVEQADLQGVERLLDAGMRAGLRGVPQAARR